MINSKLPLTNNKVEEINKNNDSHLLEPSPGAIPSVLNNNCQKSVTIIPYTSVRHKT